MSRPLPKPGARVLVDAGSYRTGRSLNARVYLTRQARGTVRVVFEQSFIGERRQADPTHVLVDIDAADLPNPHAPSTAMVPPARLDIITPAEG